MSISGWEKSATPRKPRVKEREEEFNRDGHWTRQFSVRIEPWIPLEGWVAERGYYLAAIKGKRRLYHKPFPSGTVIYIDVKEHDGTVTLTSWIQFGGLPRMLHLFMLPAAMNPLPQGLIGAVTRRQACHDLNALLERFRQPEIVGSNSVHIADLDPSTLLFAALSLVPILFYLVGSLPKIEWKPAVLPMLFAYWGNPAIYLIVAAAALVIGQELLVTRWLRERWMKGAAVGVSFAILATLAIVTLGRVNTGIRQREMVFHCLNGDTAICEKLVGAMTPKDRAALLARLQAMSQSLAVKETSPGRPR